MAIKNVPANQTLSVYDPTLGAFHEVSEADVRLQMKSLGLTDAEIESKIKKLKGEK